jgi:uncharacterized protein
MSNPKFNKVRYAKRAHYDETTVHTVLDSGLFGHVGFVVEGRPMVIPMAFARSGSTLYLHGASKTRIIKENDLAPLCVTVTHVDGIVAARSAFAHSMNYRSVVVHGLARMVLDPIEFDMALTLITEHLLPGRSMEIRPTTAQERKATGVLKLDIEAASAKIRSGPPIDDPEDQASGIWGGVLPVVTAMGRGIADAHAPIGVAEPGSFARARARFG